MTATTPETLRSKLADLHKTLSRVHGDSYLGGPVLAELGDVHFDLGEYDAALGRYEAAECHLAAAGKWDLRTHVLDRIDLCRSRLGISDRPALCRHHDREYVDGGREWRNLEWDWIARYRCKKCGAILEVNQGAP